MTLHYNTCLLARITLYASAQFSMGIKKENEIEREGKM